MNKNVKVQLRIFVFPASAAVSLFNPSPGVEVNNKYLILYLPVFLCPSEIRQKRMTEEQKVKNWFAKTTLLRSQSVFGRFRALH